MKKLFLILSVALFALNGTAQNSETATPYPPAASVNAPTLKFGYFSYDEAMKSSSDYALAQRSLKDLRAKYDAEMKRVEDEFNKKYEDFLDGQRSFAPSILKKRQSELQELIEKNMAFKKEAQDLLKQAEKEALAPIKRKVKLAAAKIGQRRGYAFILNLDGDALPYVDSTMGEDITEAVKAELQ
ncbi:OmpH family outer membrane protein [Prevotella sp. A2931]|uniref:OmpH family outer membrane protein n=1 Tax=Prevotella illustrans TaxID=2800387 RepID=A0ABS3M6J4_9BACT|nr:MULTISPECIES: OmpH family outer membrane protein [Prevotella]MBO1363789.1 OmpH family outer membrane protein [Prevotella illustrans]PTL26829.1 hypothetical protein C3V39_07140 [Prevotella sp. oral taxon 820]